MKQWNRVSLINFLFLYSVFIKVFFFFTFSSVLNWMGHESGVTWFGFVDGPLETENFQHTIDLKSCDEVWGPRMQNHQSKETIYCVCQIYEEEDGQRKPERGGEGEIPELFSKWEESSPSLWRLMRSSLGCFFVTGGPWRTAVQIVKLTYPRPRGPSGLLLSLHCHSSN